MAQKRKLYEDYYWIPKLSDEDFDAVRFSLEYFYTEVIALHMPTATKLYGESMVNAIDNMLTVCTSVHIERHLGKRQGEEE